MFSGGSNRYKVVVNEVHLGFKGEAGAEIGSLERGS